MKIDKSNSILIILVAALMTTPPTTLAIESNGKTVTLQCPRLPQYAEIDIRVDVSKSASNGSYIYEYHVSTNDKSTSPMVTFSLPEIAESKLISGFSNWGQCVIGKGKYLTCSGPATSIKTYSGLKIESKFPPGIVQFATESPFDTEIGNKNFSNLLPYFKGDRQATADAIDDAMDKFCQISMVKKNYERGITGVTTGPSDYQKAEVAYLSTTTAGDTVHRKLYIKDDLSLGVSNIKQSSIHALDSRLKNLPPPTISSELIAGEKRAGLTLDIADKTPCNVRGFIIEGTTYDGRKFRGGASVNPTTCPTQRSDFQVPLP